MLSESLRVIRPEGEIAGPLGEIAARFPDLSFGSYPFIKDGVFGANIVARGSDAGMLAQGVTALCDAFPDAV